MGAKIQAFDIFQTPLSSHYPLPLMPDPVAHIRPDLTLKINQPKIFPTTSSFKAKTEFYDSVQYLFTIYPSSFCLL